MNAAVHLFYDWRVPRHLSGDRLDDIIEAACVVFSRDGFHSAHMKAIADEAGTATGTLYNYVDGKEALFLIVVEYLSSGVLPSELPVGSPTMTETLAVLRRGLAESMNRPYFDRVKTDPTVVDIVDELQSVAGELYDALSRTRRLLSLIERCAADWPELHDAYVGEDRKGFFAELELYLTMRIEAGQVPGIAHVPAAVRFFVESLSWLAWKRFQEEEPGEWSEQSVRAAALELVVSALTNPRGRLTRRRLTPAASHPDGDALGSRNDHGCLRSAF